MKKEDRETIIHDLNCGADRMLTIISESILALRGIRMTINKYECMPLTEEKKKKKGGD